MICLPPTVCLDGTAVRQIREEKKLTQLYVAKVVGVTTDTISRWENNRYPTVKRENLLKLAEALEVTVEHLLKPESEGAEQGSASLTSARRKSLWVGIAAVMLVVLIALLLYFWIVARQSRMAAPIDFAAERILPRFAAPGSVVPVRIRLDLAGERRGYIVKERFPAGCKLIEASPPASSLDNEEGTARWIVKPGETRSLIVYLLRIDARLPVGTRATFRGEIVGSSEERNRAAAILGNGEVVVEPFNWTDSNGDGRIEDLEMLEASQAFQEMGGVHLDWKHLEQLWDAGSYHWDATKNQFLPDRPPSSTQKP